MEAETGVVQVRGYQIVDKELLASLGSGSGYVAVLVLAIYISSGVAEIHYTRHQLDLALMSFAAILDQLCLVDCSPRRNA